MRPMCGMSIGRACRANERGYTLIEFSMALLVLAIFLSFATPFMFSQLRQAKRAEDRVDLQQDARGALRKLVRELRQAQVLYQSLEHPSGNDRLSFGVDLNGDGELDPATENVTYYLKAAEDALYRGPRFNQGQPVAENVESIDFTMFGSNLALDLDDDGTVDDGELNGDGTWTANELLNVTRIHVTLTVFASDVTEIFAADAWLRTRVAG